MSLAAKLITIFLLLSIVPLSLVGYLAYVDGREAIEQDVVDRLSTTTLLKEAEFVQWLNDSNSDIRFLAQRPLVRQYAAVLVSTSPTDADYQSAYDHIFYDHFLPRMDEYANFLDLSLLRASDGLILVSTHEGLAGKYREEEAFFIEGQKTTYVGNVDFEVTMGEQVMHISTPVKNEAGTVIAVLAGHLNLADISDIMTRRSGMRASEETYLVNTFNFMVTGSAFETDAGLRRSVYTEGVNKCLTQQNGSGFYNDYRGVPVIGAYRWMPERQLCIVTEMDQSEALAPIIDLRNTILLIGAIIAAGAVMLASFFTRTLTKPIHQLATGAREIGHGNLDHRITVRSRDEIGQLASAFNEMALNLKTSLGETAYGQRMLLALSEAAQAVQRARTADEIYHTVGDQVVALGYHAIVFLLSSDRTHLKIKYLTFDSDTMKAAERLAGISVLGHSFVIEPGSFYDRVIHQGQTVFSRDTGDGLASALPETARPFSGQIATVLGLKEAIYTPLAMGNEIHGVLLVTGIGLTEADVPAISTFANQVAIAQENVRLAEDIRDHAENLEVLVAARTVELQQEKQLSDDIINGLPGVFYMIDETGMLVRWNEQFELVTGCSAEELAIKPVVDLFEGDDKTLIAERMQNVFVHGEAEAEADFVTKDGAKIPYYFTGLRITLVGKIYLMGVGIDITERRQAEETQQRYAERLTAINRLNRVISSGLEIIPIYDSFVKELLALIPLDRTAIVLLNDDGDQWQITRQWTKHEPAFAPDVWRPVRSSVIEWLVTNQVPFLEREVGEKGDWPETELLKREGIRSRLLVPLIIQGKVVGVLTAANSQPDAINEDDQSILMAIADQLAIAIQNSRLYEQVQRHADDLEQRVSERTAQLEASNKELEAFSYSVSHDLRSPLRAMDGFSRILVEEYASDLPDEAQRYLGLVRDNAQQMGHLIDHLLTFSRLGRQQLTKERVMPGEIVQNILADLRSEDKEREIEITVGNLPPCQADPTLLRQVFANLIENALKFTKTRNPAIIEVGCDNHTKEPVYFVKDNGVGFDMQYANKLFGVFQRLHRAEDYQGTGVGLANVQRIILRHSGRIWAEAEVDKGATFYFTLGGKISNDIQ